MALLVAQATDANDMLLLRIKRMAGPLFTRSQIDSCNIGWTRKDFDFIGSQSVKASRIIGRTAAYSQHPLGFLKGTSQYRSFDPEESFTGMGRSREGGLTMVETRAIELFRVAGPVNIAMWNNRS